MAKVAAVITAERVVDADREARAALAKGADLVELRLDYLRDLGSEGLRRLANAVGPKAIATLRSRAQSGVRDLPPPRRAEILAELCRLGFAYVDVELSTDAALVDALHKTASKHYQDILVSHHFSEPTEVSDVADALEACIGLGDVGKVAVPVRDLAQACALVDLARNVKLQSKRFVLIGMDGLGALTRALAEETGQEIQYAVWGRPSAPGQLPFGAAVRLRRKAPFVLGLVGHPLGHSVSPAIHEAALRAASLPGVYLSLDLQAAELPTLFDACPRLMVRGLNVTTPHKEAVAGLLDELDADAEALGAVNTVVLQEGWTRGHNTDVYGFRMALRSRGLRMGGRTALVVGAGGAAKAVVHVLLREGATVEVANRTPGRAQALADTFDEDVGVTELAGLAQRGPWDLLVNATPAGTKGVADALPVPDATVQRARFVFDLVYNPPETPLLRSARNARVPGTSGLEMLLHQAAKAFELWTGKAADLRAMERAAMEALR